MIFPFPISHFQTTAILTCALFLNSCADKPAATPPITEKKEQSQLVGRIASIHRDHNYVLIQSYGPWSVQSGAILATSGTDGRAANLKVTGEKTGQFAAADIQSGTLEIGDSVYTTLASITSSISESEETESSENPSDEGNDVPSPADVKQDPEQG